MRLDAKKRVEVPEKDGSVIIQLITSRKTNVDQFAEMEFKSKAMNVMMEPRETGKGVMVIAQALLKTGTANQEILQNLQTAL